ncbi:hypothetical protein ACWCQN_25705 [Streptomyces sp. NPDC001984]|uniref:hypothetical protein n=1 Tax=Streptomyces sp. NPDC002619 TaxID=3364655 RepID=UPI00368D5144
MTTRSAPDRLLPVLAAASVIVPQADAQVPVLIPAVRMAARGISRALGRRPEREP